MSENLLTVKQVATALACSKYTVYRLIAASEFYAVNIGDRGLRVTEESLQRFLERRAITKESA